MLCLLRRLAWKAVGEDGGPSLLLRWQAELQHLGLQATAGMMQAARVVPRTAGVVNAPFPRLHVRADMVCFIIFLFSPVFARTFVIATHFLVFIVRLLS